MNFPAGIYLFQVNKQCVKSIQDIVLGVFIINLVQISQIVLVFPWLTLNK